MDSIKNRLKSHSIEVPEKEIRDRFELLVEKFGVPLEDAERSVVNYFLKEHGVKFTPKKSELKTVASVIGAGQWLDLDVKVIELWDPSGPTIAQVGLVGDSTGTIKFTKWTSSNLPHIESGKSYRFEKVVTDEFQGKLSIKLTKTSRIIPLTEDIQTAIAPVKTSTGTMIADISEPAQWIDIKVRVVQLWEPASDAISQLGLVGDESGVVKFVKWARADLPDLEDGKSYLLKNVVTDRFQDKWSVKLNSTSTIEPLAENIEAGRQKVSFSGAIVDVQKGSGLIKRCPACKRMLTKGVCGAHGKQDGTYDLRIKAVIDDGLTAQEILINREKTEKLVGITLENAKSMAMEALDHEIVRSAIEKKLFGRYYTVSGSHVDRYIIVDSIEPKVV